MHDGMHARLLEKQEISRKLLRAIYGVSQNLGYLIGGSQ